MINILGVEVGGQLGKTLSENWDVREVEQSVLETMNNLNIAGFMGDFNHRERVIFVLGSIIYSLSV